MIRQTLALALAGIAGLFVSACQTGTTMTPATLESADDADMAVVKAVLSEAVGRATIELGAADYSTATSVTVLPPPLGPNETSSPAMPAVFDIVTNGEDCFLVSQSTGQSYALDGVGCVAAES